MGEMAVGCARTVERRNKAGAAGSGKVGGERGGRGVFLPQVCVRVLLVEADDATRNVIAALLRKCSYRVVAAADGLKAWETLKEKSQNIDLVLTEVELPSISGYGLLNMIMEHETCKHIPVIMMSSHDSINMVLKCMLKGAANFLIKPVRKNELRNLWQHVWRRHLSDSLPRGTFKHQDENLTRQKSGPNSDNNAASNHSRDRIASLCSEKGCDTQSSRTRPDMDAYTQSMQETIQPDCISSSVVNDVRNHKDDVCDKLAQKLPMHERETEGCTGDANTQSEESNEKICLSKFSREVDRIGAMDKHSHCCHELKNCCELQGDISNDAEILDDAKDKKCRPLLELPLRGHQSISADNQEKDEFNTLNHSNSSAFSRYNRTLPSVPVTSNGFRTEFGPSGDKSLFHSRTSQCSGAPLSMYLRGVDSPIGGLPDQYGSVPCSHLGLLPFPVPISGTAYGPFSSYGPIIPPLFYAQSGTPVWSLKTTKHEATHSSLSCQSDQETISSEQHGDHHGQNVEKHFYQMQKEQAQNIESLNERSHVASVTGQSSSCVCNGSRSHANSCVCGSICDGSDRNFTANSVSRSTLETADGNGLCIHDEVEQAGSHGSVIRQTDVIKFHSKRKERCHEKKVHNQSRKKLAEEHPRVQGQFARQVLHSPGTMEADSYTAVDNCMPLPIQM